jgi:D-xylose isomerase (EC 5.3.1.5)
MKDWTRFAMAYWHTLCANGGDPFGGATIHHPWNIGDDAISRAKIKNGCSFRIHD